MAANKQGRFFQKYRDAILFNKNLILSAACGFFASAFVSDAYSKYDNNEFVISAVALATEYGFYIPIFAALFYIDNRQKYFDPVTRRKNSQLIRQDIKKLFAAFSVSEVIFAVTRILTQYQFLQVGIEPYQASMAGSLIAWGVFFVCINYLVKLARLFKK